MHWGDESVQISDESKGICGGLSKYGCSCDLMRGLSGERWDEDLLPGSVPKDEDNFKNRWRERLLLNRSSLK